MKKPVTIEEIYKLFPEIDMIGNKEWGQKVAKIWKEAYELSAWDNITDAWFNPLTPGINLITHTRSNVLGALALADVQKKLFNIDMDRDILITSCLLHDVCKIIEFVPDAKAGAVKGSIGKVYQHGFYSAYFAQREAFPEKVVAILIAHTGESRKTITSPEGLALYYADVLDADVHRMLAGSPLLLDAHK